MLLLLLPVLFLVALRSTATMIVVVVVVVMVGMMVPVEIRPLHKFTVSNIDWQSKRGEHTGSQQTNRQTVLVG